MTRIITITILLVLAVPAIAHAQDSLIVVRGAPFALIAMNRPPQLHSHLGLALRNGVTEEELIVAITHLAFYSGWPSAVTAIGVAREVFEQR